MKISRYTCLLISLCISIGCKPDIQYNFEGKWQSLNESANVIEFTSDQKIVLYKDGKSFWSTVTTHGELNCQIVKESKRWYTFTALDGSDFFFKGRIEIINSNRIRIYLLKHHDILDLADEYHRTNDFKSYQTILSDILEEPE